MAWLTLVFSYNLNFLIGDIFYSWCKIQMPQQLKLSPIFPLTPQPLKSPLQRQTLLCFLVYIFPRSFAIFTNLRWIFFLSAMQKLACYTTCSASCFFFSLNVLDVAFLHSSQYNCYRLHYVRVSQFIQPVPFGRDIQAFYNYVLVFTL